MGAKMLHTCIRVANLEKSLEDSNEEIVRLNNEVETYCNLFNASCEGCKVREFMNKYSKVGKMECNDVYRYLKEKGEI